MKPLIAALFLALAFAGLGRAENAIPDGGFEGGKGKWNNLWGVTSGSLSTEHVRSGKTSAKLEHPQATTTGWQRQTTDLESGFLYRVAVHSYRTTNTISSSVTMHTDTPPYSRSAKSEKSKRIDEWEHLSADIATRRNGTIWIEMIAEGSGSIWFDDVTVTVLKTRDERKKELLARIESKAATKEEKSQAYLDLGEIEFINKEPEAAAQYYALVTELSPKDVNRCRQALDARAFACRRAKDFSDARAALKKLVEDYSTDGTLEEARSLTNLGWALGEEADHVMPDYAAALKILDEALRVFSKAAAIYREIDPVAHKYFVDTLEDRLTVTRYDINAYRELGSLN
jgi:hypothetical protein